MNVRSTEAKMDKKSSDSISAHKLRCLFLVLFACLSLVARAFLSSPYGAGTIEFYLGAGVPGFVVLLSLGIALEYAVNRKRPALLRVSSRSRRLAASTYSFAMIVCLLDAAAGLSPYLFVPGMVVYSFMIWDRPGFLAVSSSLGAAAILRTVVVSGRAVAFEDVVIAAVGVMLSLYGADTIHKSVLPSEERLKSLQAENEELWNLSFRDTLTGLYNRRYIQQIATHLLVRAVRYKEQLHVLMIDIDHFKRVNDKLGHAVGDDVLKGIAQTIQATIRTSDTVARYGGEEFIVYMVKSDPETTQFIANRIRDGVAAIRFPEVPWSVTISIGVAGLQDGDSVESIVERADQFLYVSKHRGRNRVSGF